MKLFEVSKPEIRLFLKWLRHPGNLFETLKHFIRLGSSQHQSLEINHSIPAQNIFFNKVTQVRYFTSVAKSVVTSNKKVEQVSVPLAGTDFTINFRTRWLNCFLDREDYSALHRFGWLNKSPHFFASYELGYRLIESWIQRFHHHQDDFAYQSYNIAERLINWTLFFTRWRAYDFPNDDTKQLVFSSMRRQLNILTNSLEIHGEYTNNHLVNDGRGLYIVGSFLNESQIIDLGRKCLRFGFENLISQKGFLKEHSTHYHLLLTKNYLEVFLIAREFGDDFSTEVEPFVKKMLEVCLELCVQSSNGVSMPFVGDISPDASPDWLASVLAVLGNEHYRKSDSAQIVWSDIWDLSNFSLFDSDNFSTMTNGGLCDAEAGFFLLKREPFRLCVHNPNSMHKSHFSHFHFDDLSFSLIIDGVPIIQDPGRPNYIKSELLGLYARLPHAHNTVFLAGHSIASHNSKLFPKRFYSPSVHIENYEQGPFCEVTVNHEGFRRVKSKTQFQRQFKLSNLNFTLSDRWQLIDDDEVMTRFHFSHFVKKVTQNDNNLLLELASEMNNDIRFNFKVENLVTVRLSKGILGQVPETCCGWSFPQYGQSLPTFTVDFVQKASGSFINYFEIGGNSDA